MTHGDFGHGVYLPIDSAPTGFLRLRAKIHCSSEQTISDSEYLALEDDLTGNTGLMLDSKGIRAIVKTEGDRLILLCIRNRNDIEPLGIVGGSGRVPKSSAEFRIVDFKREDDGIIVDIEMAETGASLNKASWRSPTLLGGTPLNAVSAKLDRPTLKAAIARCEQDGVSLTGLQIKVAEGIPDFLDGGTHGFVLAPEGIIWIVPHDCQGAIAQHCKILSMRLRSGVKAGAIPADEALELLSAAANLSVQWWLERLIKTLIGAARCEQAFGILNGGEIPPEYLRLLFARGFEFWGDRHSALLCMAHDFRLSYDPSGLPNCVTMEWDLAVPSIARMSQATLSRILPTFG
jgi:hypothetical protein